MSQCDGTFNLKINVAKEDNSVGESERNKKKRKTEEEMGR